MNSQAGVADVLLRSDVRSLCSHLRGWSGDGPSELAAARTGAFALAESGLLDKRRATTSWWLDDVFSSRHPKAELDMSRMVVSDGPITTAAAAAFAHIDLAMNFVARISPQLAEMTAAVLFVDERPARSVNSALSYLSSADKVVADSEAWTRSHLDQDIGVADAALAIGSNRRTLERRDRQRMGVTPCVLVRHLRVERANHLRKTTNFSLIRAPGWSVTRALGHCAGP